MMILAKAKHYIRKKSPRRTYAKISSKLSDSSVNLKAADIPKTSSRTELLNIKAKL